MLPDWIPNIHPLIVHFPIALLVFGAFFDFARLFIKNKDWMGHTTLSLYIFGSIGLIAAFLSGRDAVNTVVLTGDAITVVTLHEDWALYTLIFFVIFTAIRFWFWWNERDKGWVLPILVSTAFVGVGMLWYTGELGAKLVYKHGVAVSEINRLNQKVDEIEQLLAEVREVAGPVIHDDESWVWRIGPASDQVFTESFVIQGHQELSIATRYHDNRNHLEIEATETKTYITLNNRLRVIEGKLEVNLEDFDGSLLLIHHFSDLNNYQFLRISERELQQGQKRNGQINILGSGTIKQNGWNTFRVTASGRHFYGYQNELTILHTHADEMTAGATGIAFVGTGTIKMRMIEFVNLN